jgi:hypothetical protein
MLGPLHLGKPPVRWGVDHVPAHHAGQPHWHLDPVIGNGRLDPGPVPLLESQRLRCLGMDVQVGHRLQFP